MASIESSSRMKLLLGSCVILLAIIWGSSSHYTMASLISKRSSEDNHEQQQALLQKRQSGRNEMSTVATTAISTAATNISETSQNSIKMKDQKITKGNLKPRDIFLLLLKAMPQETPINIHVYLDGNDDNKNTDGNPQQSHWSADDQSIEIPTGVIQKSRVKRQFPIFPTPYNWDYMRWSRPRPRPYNGQQESMKRVIFTRCPFYPCPQGFVCDYRSNTCRSLFFPDYDI